MERTCYACNQTKPLTQFASDPSHKSGHRNICKSCHAERTKERMGKRREKRRELIQSKKEVPCADCGNKFPHYVMDFDHVKGRKLFDISQAIGKNVSDVKLLRELEKCEVVCANCHRIRSFKAGHIRQPGAPTVSRKISPEWRARLSIAQTGKKLSLETKEKMSKTHQIRKK